MANLLIVVPGPAAEQRQRARQTFRHGMSCLQSLKGSVPALVLESGFADVASYRRRNGSGSPVVSDPASGNWLVAVGTWFHDQGYGVGHEARLLARLNEIGPDRLARELEGFFAIVTGEAATGEVTVITDIAGTLHCYMRQLDGAVALSVSSLVLAALGEVTLDPVGCQEFLQTQAMYEDRTFFNEVRKLDAASCYHFKAGSLARRTPYWSVRDLAPDSLDGQASVDAFRAAVVGAAQRIESAFPSPAVDLTGGYDSRAGVAAFMAAGVAFSSTVAGAPGSADVRIAAELAQRAGLDHRYIEPAPVRSFAQLQAALALTDGEYDLVDYARIRQVQESLVPGFDISINSYSGELGRGYGWEVLGQRVGQREPLDVAKVARRRFVNPVYDPSVVRPADRIDAAEHFTRATGRYAAGLEDLPNTLQYDWCMTMMRCQRWYGRIASSTNQIWPCMSFFLLRSVMQPMLETNTRSRRNSILFRRFLSQSQPALAQVPLERGYPPLPVAWNTLHRFWPLVPLYTGKAVNRIRRQLSPPGAAPQADSPRMHLWRDPAVQELLSPARLRSTQVLDGTGVEAFLQRSREPDFRFESQWSLLLSLEAALQRADELRRLAAVPLPAEIAPATAG